MTGAIAENIGWVIVFIALLVGAWGGVWFIRNRKKDGDDLIHAPSEHLTLIDRL